MYVPLLHFTIIFIAASPCNSTTKSKIVTFLASRSTSIPALAYSYKAFPSFFKALCMGGICAISPLNCGKTDCNNSSLTFTSRRSNTSPSASPVVVLTPNAAMASYRLSASKCSWLNFVAAPKHSGSKPVASGSKVPVCPAFSALNNHFAFCKASLLDIPFGLSNNKTP